MKLKWYDWDGVGEIPSEVVGIRHRDEGEFFKKDSVFWGGKSYWIIFNHPYDIIAYTLGEPLEGGE